MQALWNYFEFWLRGLDHYQEVNDVRTAPDGRQILAPEQCIKDFSVHVENDNGRYFLTFSPEIPGRKLNMLLTRSSLTPLDNRH
jgi:hypothetical protein